MDYLNVILVSVSMAIDASCVNINNGLIENDIKWYKLMLIGFLFGIFQFIMPTIGYFIGQSFVMYLEKISLIIPIIGFILLLFLSINSFIEWKKNYKEKAKLAKKELKGKDIVIECIATSIDALCIGFVYILESVQTALLIFLTIGIITFILSILAGLFGKKIGSYIKKYALLLASLVFLIIGSKILIEGIIDYTQTLNVIF